MAFLLLLSVHIGHILCAGSHFSHRSSSEYVEIYEYSPYVPNDTLISGNINTLNVKLLLFFSSQIASFQFNTSQLIAHSKRCEWFSIQLEYIRNCFASAYLILFNFCVSAQCVMCFWIGFCYSICQIVLCSPNSRSLHLWSFYIGFINICCPVGRNIAD